MLRQAENKIYIEGILAENDLNYGSYTKDGKTVEMISGKVTVKVTKPINGVEKELMIPVHYFQQKYKKDGNPNPVYTSLETAMKEYVSIAASDEASADRVRITASLEMNEYYPQPGKLSSFPRLRASFINRITKDQCHPKAEGQIEFCVGEKSNETSADGELTGRLIFKAIVPQYGGKVDVIPLYAANSNVIDVVDNYWNSGDTVKAKVKLNFTSETREIVEEVDFGEPTVRTRTINLSEILIVGGNQTPYDEDSAFSKSDIQAGLADRKARLAAQEAKDASRAKTKAAPAKSSGSIMDLGF